MKTLAECGLREWRREDSGHRLALPHRGKTRTGVAEFDELVIALAETAAGEQLLQYEREAGRERINGEVTALEIRDRLDLGPRDQAQRAIAAAEDRYEVGILGRVGRALAFRIGDDVVERGRHHVELALDQAEHLGGRRDGVDVLDSEPFLGEEALLLRGPDRPDVRALDRVGRDLALRLRRGGEGEAERDEKRSEASDGDDFPQHGMTSGAMNWYGPAAWGKV